MFLSKKKKINSLIDTVIQALGIIFMDNAIEQRILDCHEAINAIRKQISDEDTELVNSRIILHQILDLFMNFINESLAVNDVTVQRLIKNIIEFKKVFEEEVHVKLNILFLPYKASMWDSLESIYEEAKADKDCAVKVVPIPYYQLGQGIETPSYEGNLFPEAVSITHYNSYNFATELPDIIYVHNIYDQYNQVTRVHEFFYTENLKKYTDMLVYVPYHISEPYKNDGGNIRAAYYLPGIKNVDKVVLSGKFIEEEAIRDGIPKNKILTLGSPKFDSMRKSMNIDYEYSSEIKSVTKDKKVILLTTACNFFCNGKFSNIDTFNLLVDIPRYLDDYILVWRPHPLTLETTKRFKPENVETVEAIFENFRSGKKNYNWWNNFLLDETPDYFPTLKLADILITDGGSLMQSFLLTKKPIMLLSVKNGMPATYLLPKDSFYYFFDHDEPWYQFFKKFADDYDPLKEKRNNLASSVYENTDGTCGKKIHDEIKRELLNL